mgnify:CR=1 FL=1
MTEVTYMGEYKIGITFEDGVTGSVDLTDLVNSGIFELLKDKSKFAKKSTDTIDKTFTITSGQNSTITL